jgi:hypothetical protein
MRPATPVCSSSVAAGAIFRDHNGFMALSSRFFSIFRTYPPSGCATDRKVVEACPDRETTVRNAWSITAL